MDEEIGIRKLLRGMVLDWQIYGNSFMLPIAAREFYYRCSGRCGRSFSRDSEYIKFKGYNSQTKQIKHQCAKCGTVDLYIDVPKDAAVRYVRCVRLNPENFNIEYNPLNGECTYYYSIPARVKQRIREGDPDYMRDLPPTFITAANRDGVMKFRKDRLFHFANTGLAEEDMGWGKPPILPVMRAIFHNAVTRKAEEQILMEHIIPLRILYPGSANGISPIENMDMGMWASQLSQWLQIWKSDHNAIPISTFPVGVSNVGGDARALLATPNLQEYYKMLTINGMGMPREFVEGGLCVSPDTLLFTSNGMETIEEVAPENVGSSAVSGRTIVSHQGVRSVVLAHHVGKKSAAQMWTKLGLEFIGAHTHPILTLQPDLSMQFKNMDQLKPGDRVAVKAGANLWPDSAPKIEFVAPENNRFRDVTIPAELTPKLARLLGYLIAEGSCVDERRIGFGNSDPEVLQDFSDCCHDAFGYRPEFHKNFASSERGTRDFFQTEISRRQAVSFLYHLGVGGYAAEKTTPWIIRRAPKNLVAEYLRAYFEGDGGTEDVDEKQSVSATSMSPRLLQETQLLLLNMGIVSSRYRPYKERPCYGLQIRSGYVDKYAEEIGFISMRKREVLAARTPTMMSASMSRKVPYLADRIDEFRKRYFGARQSWTFEPILCELTQDFYSVDEVAELVDRERSTIGIYVRSGALKAEKTPSVDGRFAAYRITKEDLRDFLTQHGLGRHRSVPRHQFEISYERLSGKDLSFIREKEPELAERIEALSESRFVWDEIKEIELLDDEIPMRDLTVDGAHSYQGNGILCHNSYSGSSMSLRMVRNGFEDVRIDLRKAIDFTKRYVMRVKGLADISIDFSSLQLADDVQKTDQMLQLMGQSLASRKTVLSQLGLNYDDEQRRIKLELVGDHEIKKMEAAAAAESQAETSIIAAKAQARAQYEGEKVVRDLQQKERMQQVIDMQLKRRSVMLAMPDPELQGFIQSGGASVSDVIYLTNQGRIPVPSMLPVEQMVQQLQDNAVAQFGINPHTLEGLPPDLAVIISNNVMPPNEIVSAIQSVIAQQQQEAAQAAAEQGQPPPEGGGEKGGPPQHGGAPPTAAPAQGDPAEKRAQKIAQALESAKTPADRAMAEAHYRSADPEAFHLAMKASKGGKPMPEKLPPRRDGGSAMS